MTDTPNHPPRKGPPRPCDVLERINGSATPHEMRDPFDIGETFTSLAASGEALTIYPSGLADPVLARIDAVHPEEPHFTLDVLKQIPPGRATFVAALGGNAKLQFDLTGEWIPQPGMPNMVPAVFPESCLVLNRRAAPRLDTPINGSYAATFTLLNKQFELPLCDYSTSGVGLRATPDQAVELYVGRKLKSVRLQLGPALAIVADLEIRLLRPFRSFLLGEQVQVGCSIDNIEMQMQQTLQRLVTSNRGRQAA
ncbi:PilZ domain-containing protein [Massilia suwonensis]|uniref:PilZ domain-containing protein n=1 Tax=Massilia suwonensis TaxID=648895 RepID=A0ABW0MN06_9BURK